jgi:hypothetical protein
VDAYDALPLRLPPLARAGTVFSWGLRRTFRSRLFVVSAGLALLAGWGLGAIVPRHDDAAEALWVLLGEPFLGIVVPLVALALVGTGFGEEVQEQTLVFHLVRPVSRRTVFLARYASGVPPAALVSALLIVTAVWASGVPLPVRATWTAAGVAAVGAATVGALYYALAALFRRGLIAGLVYTFLIEGAFQFLPGTVQKLSLMHHVRSVFHRLLDDDFSALSSRVSETVASRAAGVDADAEAMALAAAERVEWTSVPTALVLFAAVIAVTLFAGARAVARKDFALKD